MARFHMPFRSLVAFAIALASGGPAFAQDGGAALPDFAAETLTGDWSGQRSALAARGFDVRLNYTGDLLGNLSGGIRRGWTYQGLAEIGVDLDFERAFGWRGGRAHVSALQIHGPSLTDRYVGAFATLSSIDARPATRLFEAWFEERLSGDAASLRIDQMAVDREFYLSGHAGHFVNASFGWPAIFAEALPAGGNAYPIATPGVRLRLGGEEEGLSFRLGVFNGDPDSNGRNRSGTRFDLTGGAFVMGELSYAFTGALPGTYRVGARYHGGRFEALRSGEIRRGNHSLYAVADQSLWRPDPGSERGIGVFARMAGVPGRRNMLDLAFDAGVTWQGMLAGRPDNVLGLGVSPARLSAAAREAALAEGALLRRGETVVELSYAAQVVPSWQVQPEDQLVCGPGGEQDRRRPVVIGQRASLAF
jgi:porin